MGEEIGSLPQQLQEQIARLQDLQRTLQIVVAQKTQLEIEFADTNRALEELEKIGDAAPLYKSIGALLVRSERNVIIKELKERKELVNTRITVLARQEERSREKANELQHKVQARLREPNIQGQ